MIDYMSLIRQYYEPDTELYRILLTHSGLVAERALAVCGLHPELGADRDFIREAAMLHDIGIFLCDAPGIHCCGTEPYIRHGVLGAEIVRKAGWERHARVCERHTGTGLSRHAILERKLPLPPIDLVPETIEEQIICYADKFYSKTHPDKEKPLERVLRSLERFGAQDVERFRAWHERFR